MARYDFDLFTLGAGSGGVAGSRRAVSYGAKVGIAEMSRVGGTCVIRGCVPKKLLVYGAHVADELADAAGYGWEIGPSRFDWGILIANKDREIDRLNGVYLKLLADSGVRLYETRARIADPHTIEFDDGRRVTAERILVSVGAKAVMPVIPGIGHAITSNEALDLKVLPRRVVIAGGGYIAVEFAGIFKALGSEVTLVIRSDKLLRGFDEDIRDFLGGQLRERGINISPATRITGIERGADGLSAVTDQGDILVADQILYATGRLPNTGDLGLAEVGVALDADGAVKVDEWSRSSVPSIFAVGDVTNRINLTPVAIAEARALAETLYNNNPTMFDPSNVPSAVFSQPPVGVVGLTEAEARAAGRPIDIYRSTFRPMKHTLTGRAERTMMKLVVARDTDVVLGCHMVGADAPEITQGLAIALKCGATKKQFDQTIGIHPTAAEEFVTMRDKVPEPVRATGGLR